MFELAQGCILVASWVNCPLLAIEIFECVKYFRRFPGDVKAYQVAVVLALAIDVATVISVFAAVWLYTISNWGNAAYQYEQPWPIAFYLFAVALSAAICQAYLAWRVYRFSRQIWLLIVLVIPILGSVIGAFLTGQGAINVTLATRASLTFYVTLWLSFKAGADIMIAAACIWQLRRVKAVFGDTQSIIRRLSIQSVETGSITAVFAIAALALYNTLPSTNLSIAIAMCLGRVYSITMLSNLNRRQVTGTTAEDELSRSRTHGGRSGFGVVSGKGQQGLGSKGGVTVLRETHVNYDETPDHFDVVQPAAVIYRSKHDRTPTPSQKMANDLTAWGTMQQPGPGASDIELARGEPLRHA